MEDLNGIAKIFTTGLDYMIRFSYIAPD